VGEKSLAVSEATVQPLSSVPSRLRPSEIDSDDNMSLASSGPSAASETVRFLNYSTGNLHRVDSVS